MQLQQNISLKSFTSFGIEVFAQYYCAVTSIPDIEAALDTQKKLNTQRVILGGGSNILFTQNIHGFVLHNQLSGIHILEENKDTVLLKVMAGESWHKLVEYCVNNNWGGIENLSLIPGNCGAAPIQNIGAYGVEIKDVLHSVSAIQIADGKEIELSNKECSFGYRDSIFKREMKEQCIITSITLRLQKNPTFNISYGAIEAELANMGITTLSVASISQAVINIRTSKLPNPTIIGNAGSFFKNPVISQKHYQQLVQTFPLMPSYPFEDVVKIPAGWLIEQCGWKGYRKGDAGCYTKQALVLVNYGNASGKEIFQLSQTIIESVNEKFSIQLEREVNIL